MPQADQIAPAVEDFRNESVMEGKFPCQQGHIMDFVRDQNHPRMAKHEFGNVFAVKYVEPAFECETAHFSQCGRHRKFRGPGHVTQAVPVMHGYKVVVPRHLQVQLDIAVAATQGLLYGFAAVGMALSIDNAARVGDVQLRRCGRKGKYAGLERNIKT